MENTILIIISSIFLFWVNYITFPKLIELVNSENMRTFGRIVTGKQIGRASCRERV